MMSRMESYVETLQDNIEKLERLVKVQEIHIKTLKIRLKEEVAKTTLKEGVKNDE